MDRQSSSKNTFQGVQSEIERMLDSLPGRLSQLPDWLKALRYLAPYKGERTKVSLRALKSGKFGRKPNVPVDDWSRAPRVLQIDIFGRPTGQTEDAPAPLADRVHSAASLEATNAQDTARDLVVALAKAEQDPQLGFVSLKWFRDAFLPLQGFAWADTTDNRQRVLVEAINRKWVLTSRVANPRNPQYPVTAIKVNRPLPEVRQLLEQAGGSRATFAPITISGERLSETVLRDRR